MNNFSIEIYKGYKIWQLSKTITVKLPKGRSYTDLVPVKNKYYIGGKFCCTEYSSVQKCRDYIDYITSTIEFNKVNPL